MQALRNSLKEDAQPEEFSDWADDQREHGISISHPTLRTFRLSMISLMAITYYIIFRSFFCPSYSLFSSFHCYSNRSPCYRCYCYLLVTRFLLCWSLKEVDWSALQPENFGKIYERKCGTSCNTGSSVCFSHWNKSISGSWNGEWPAWNRSSSTDGPSDTAVIRTAKRTVDSRLGTGMLFVNDLLSVSRREESICCGFKDHRIVSYLLWWLAFRCEWDVDSVGGWVLGLTHYCSGSCKWDE